MSRLIDADKLKETIHINHYPLRGGINSIDNGMWTIGIDQAIDEQPTIDAVPVVHGHWIYDASDMRCVCSECNHHLFQIVRPVEFKSFAEQNKFCFNCGADMRERKQDDTQT